MLTSIWRWCTYWYWRLKYQNSRIPCWRVRYEDGRHTYHVRRDHARTLQKLFGGEIYYARNHRGDIV